METAELLETYPRLFHIAEAGSWPSIRRHGLLSVSALLDLFGVDGTRRDRLEASRRPTASHLRDGRLGSAVLRDQIPLRERPLEQCLVGMTPAEWYRELNRRVFFWLSEERVERLLGAAAYRDRQHDVLTVETASLVAAHEDEIALALINTGSTIFKPQPRGVGTFLRIAKYPFDDLARRRGRRKAIAELTVEYGVPDIARHTLAVHARRHGRPAVESWRR